MGEVGPGAECCLGGACRQLMVFPGRPCSALWLDELVRRKERLLEPSRPVQGRPAMAWAVPPCLLCLVKRDVTTARGPPAFTRRLVLACGAAPVHDPAEGTGFARA